MGLVVHFQHLDFVVEIDKNDYDIVEVYKDWETGEFAESSVARITSAWTRQDWREFEEVMRQADSDDRALKFGGD